MERTVDFAALGRVAKRAELTGISLVEIAAKCDPQGVGSLQPNVDLDCKPGAYSGNRLDVICDYTFSVSANEAKIAEATIKYRLTYELVGSESPADADLAEFARANGALHSWPYVRELLYSLTSRMGYPAYILPAMHFSSIPRKKDSAPATSEGSEPSEAPEIAKHK